MPTVALTGATGFIGGNLLVSLLGHGLDVRALTRSRRPPMQGVAWIPGNLLDRTSLEHLVEGAMAIIHCGGTVRGASLEHFTRVNRDGTCNLVEAAGRVTPPARFLLISSAAAREPLLSWYARSKYEAEQCLEAAAPRLDFTIFRPTAVYGPGDREVRPLLQAMRRGILPLAASRHSRFSLLHVNDLVEAALLWLKTPAVPAGPFELHDGKPGGYDWDNVKTIAESTWGRRILTLPVPLPLLRSAAAVNVGWSRLTGREPMLTPGKVRELTHSDWVCDNGPVSRALQWQPAITLDAAMRNETLLGL